jgi:hypothetical protein
MRSAQDGNERPFVHGCEEQIAMDSHMQRQEYGAMIVAERAVAPPWRCCGDALKFKLVPLKQGAVYHVSTPLFYVFITSSSLSPLFFSRI